MHQVSQISRKKNCNLKGNFFETLFPSLHKIKTRTKINNQRPVSHHHVIENMERDINVQKREE